MGIIIVTFIFTFLLAIVWSHIARSMVTSPNASDLSALATIISMFVVVGIIGLLTLIHNNYKEAIIKDYNTELVTKRIVTYSTNVITGCPDVVPYTNKKE